MRLCPTCLKPAVRTKNSATTFINYECFNKHEWTVTTQIVAKAVTP